MSTMAGLRGVFANAAVLILLVCALGPVDSAPVISAPWGQISGQDETSPEGRTHSAYLGIPYALPPVGERRFAKPVAHPGPGSNRVFNASTRGPECPQLGSKYQSEDCLKLNVYVPTTATGSTPVMLWIHGGSFISGSALLYEPSTFITENDVIVVVIQYRLGPLGFLSSGDSVIPGNFGLQDQTLAIQWVKDNIQAFGGDPNRITIFGQSAGSISVGFQLLTPYTRGLFSRAILQSGIPNSRAAVNDNPAIAFKALANRTGCWRPMSWSDSAYYAVTGGRQQAENQRALECLRRADFAKLIGSAPGGFTLGNPWAPVVDGDYLPKDPRALLDDQEYLERNEIYSRDIILGINNEEGSLILGLAGARTPSYDDLVASLPRIAGLKRRTLSAELAFQYGESLENDQRRMDLLVDVGEFFYSDPGSRNELQTLQDAADLSADVSFTVPLVKFARRLFPKSPNKKSGKTSVSGRRYMYLLNHYPASKAGLAALRGMYHSEQLAYVFDPVTQRVVPFSGEDAFLATTFKSIISNFAKTGDPQLSLPSGETWPEYTLESEEYLSLAPTPLTAQRLYAKRVDLWLDLLANLYNSTRSTAQCQRSLWWWMGSNSGCSTSAGGGMNHNMYNNYNYNMMNNRVPFYFKGRINFYKLPNRAG